MNKFVKVLIATLSIMSSAGTVFADSYLYFMVNDAQYKTGDSVSFDYATVKVDGSDSYLSLYSTGGIDLGSKVASNGGNSTAMADLGYGYYAGFSGEASTMTFLVGLWESVNDGTPIAYQSFAGAGLSQYIFSATSAGGGSSPLTVTTVVPEPTSGLLVFIGFAALALRRRRT